MKKLFWITLNIVLITAVAIGSHVWTMYNLRIETDGDGDSAIIEVAGQYWFYGINGYEPDGEFYAEYDGEGFLE